MKNLKKLLSIGIVSSMMASMMISAVNGGNDETINRVWVMSSDDMNIKNGNMITKTEFDKEHIIESNGSTRLVQGIKVSGNQGEIKYIAFGHSVSSVTNPQSDPLFKIVSANNQGKNGQLDVIPMSTSIMTIKSVNAGVPAQFVKTNKIKYDKVANEMIRNKHTITLSNGTTHNATGSLNKPLLLRITFSNELKNNAYGFYDVKVGNNENIRIIAESRATEEDTSKVATNKDADSATYKFNEGEKVPDPLILGAESLKIMSNGNYFPQEISFQTNGLSIAVNTLSPSTLEESMRLSYKLAAKHDWLSNHYNSNGDMKTLFITPESGFYREAVTYNVDTQTSNVIESWKGEVYAYIVNKANIDQAARSSSTDGLVSDDKCFEGKYKDGTLAFTIPGGKCEPGRDIIMISSKKLDIAKLPVIPGLTSDELSAPLPENTILAPIVEPVASAAPIDSITPVTSADSNAALTTAPEPTHGKGTASTGEVDMFAVALVVAVLSTVAAGTVAFKKN